MNPLYGAIFESARAEGFTVSYRFKIRLVERAGWLCGFLGYRGRR